MKLYLRVMWVFLKYSLTIMLLLLTAPAIVDVFVNWEQDSIIIENEYPKYSGVLVGYRYQSTTYQGATKSNIQRSYWLIPKSFTSPKMLSINYNEGGNISHEATTEGFWFSVVVFILLGLACYFVWVRGYDPFNKLSKRDAEKLGVPF